MGCRPSKVTPHESKTEPSDQHENADYLLQGGNRSNLIISKEELLLLQRKRQNEASILTQLKEEGILADAGAGGISFYVPVAGGNVTQPTAKKPPRLLEKLENRHDHVEGQFNVNDKALMADVLHREKIAKTVENARKTLDRQIEASKRRSQKERRILERMDRKRRRAEEAQQQMLKAIEERSSEAAEKQASVLHRREMKEILLLEKTRQKEANAAKRKLELEDTNNTKKTVVAERQVLARQRRDLLLSEDISERGMQNNGLEETGQKSDMSEYGAVT